MNHNFSSEKTDPLRRLRWQCRRGLLELDVLLERFLNTRYEQLSEEKKTQFTQLLQYSDQQLLYWLTDQEIPPEHLKEIIIAIQYTTVYIGLGSNLNQPILQLKTAIASLQQIPNTRFISVSHFYHTAPQGFTDQPDFINAVACVQTQLSSRALLSALQEIEKKQGRIRDAEKNGPRIIDLDLLLYGEQTIDEIDLTIPHPRLEERAFVLVPLMEITPELILPNGKHVRDCLSHLDDTKKIVRRID